MSGQAAPPDARLRLFVACEIPEAEREALAAWGEECAAGDRALRALSADALHITLHFIGWQPPERADGLAAALREGLGGAPSPVRLRLGDVLWLAPRRPHVLTCAVVDESGALGAIQARLGEPLARAAEDWRPEQRTFRPHVTVARVRRGERPRTGAAPAPPRAEFTATAVTLMRSHLGPTGARYEALASVPPV